MSFRTNAVKVQAFAGAMFGVQVGSTTMAQINADITSSGGLANALNAYYTSSFGNATTASVAATVAANLGLTGDALASGTAFITAQLNGAAAGARGAVISTILDQFAGLASDATFGAAATAYNAKIATAVAYTGATNVAVGTVVEAAPGVFAFTTGLDNLNGTAGNDTFVGDAATITSSDQVNGGAGTDTVKIYDLAAATDVPTMSGVETVEIINADAPANLNLTGVTELVSLVLDNTTSLDDYLIGSAVNVTVKNMLATESVTLTSRATDTAADLTVQSLDAADAGTVTVNFDDATITTVNLTSSGSTKNNLTFATTGPETTVNVTGATEMVLVNNATSITTFNAANSTGGVTFNMSNATGASQTITGGSGNDTLTADLAVNVAINAGAGNDVVALVNATAANLSSATGTVDSINGGDGTDTLSLIAAGATELAGDTAADRAVITGFEQLRVSDNLNAASFSIAPFGLNHFQIATATTTAAATVSGFTSGATVESRAAADSTVAVNIGMTGATNAGTPDDLLNVRLNANLVDQANAADAIEVTLGISGINKLVVTTADRVNIDAATDRADGYILTLANDNSMTQMTVSGDRELSFTSTASTANLATFDASALTGNLILNLTTNGMTQGAVLTGGAGTNTITGTGFADTITGGARADTITLGAGADTVTGGAGADTFIVADANYTAATAAALSAAADSITDFAKGSDIIDFDAALTFVTAAATAVAGAAAINAEGIASFADADDTLAERIIAVAARADGDGDFAIFTFGADTYVFINSNTDTVVSAGDALIKLVGVSGLSDVTINGANNITIA